MTVCTPILINIRQKNGTFLLSFSGNSINQHPNPILCGIWGYYKNRNGYWVSFPVFDITHMNYFVCCRDVCFPLLYIVENF